MEISYWQSRWRNEKTRWHMQEVFPLLKTFWNKLPLEKGGTVLVPLCGKSLDLEWLVNQGHYVIGVDVSQKAIKALVQSHEERFEKSAKGNLQCYKSESMELWCGDFFKLQQSWLPAIDVIYDKAALIALPPEMRKAYVDSLKNLLQPHTQVFINCFEYEQDEMPGPPFAVFREEMESHFGDQFYINSLYAHSLFDELTNFHRRGLHSYLREKIYHLSPK